jgi:hypothetical protein
MSKKNLGGNASPTETIVKKTAIVKETKTVSKDKKDTK